MPATPSDNSRAMTMTDKEKAKAYDEALERAKLWAEGKVEDDFASSKSVAEFLFPELKVSEDEKARKWIWNLLHKLHYHEDDHFMALKAIEWLEKQKEPKPLTDDEKEYIRTIKSIISDFIRDKKPENLAYYQRIYDWLDGRHVPFSCGHENGKPEWSEDDERMLRTIISDGSRGVELDSRQIAWLKSLSPQSQGIYRPGSTGY